MVSSPFDSIDGFSGSVQLPTWSSQMPKRLSDLITQSRKIAVDLSLTRPAPKFFLQHRAYIVTLDYDAPRYPPSDYEANCSTPEAKRFLARLSQTMGREWAEMSAVPSTPIVCGSRVSQTIVFGTTPRCDNSFWWAFPNPPRKPTAKTSWSFPMRYRDLHILWRQTGDSPVMP